VRDSISLLTLAFFVPVAAGAVGCVSNEYVIPHDELVRVASLPPAIRGARIHAVQSLGGREGDPVEPPALFAPAASPDAAESASGTWAAGDEAATSAASANDVGAGESDMDVDSDTDDDSDSFPRVDLRVDGGAGASHVGPGGRVGPHGPSGPRTLRVGEGSWVGPPPPRLAAGRVLTTGGQTPERTVRNGGHAPSTGSIRAGGVYRGGAGSSSGIHLSGGGGGGGDGGAEMLVVLAVVMVAVATFAMIGLAASEGARFDGYVETSPDQPIHLESSSGAHLTVPLADLTVRQVAGAVEAKIMDDEGPGLRLLEHHLDRRGFAFKLDFGGVAFERESSTQSYSGLTSHIQLGYFFTPAIGVLATAGLGLADDGIGATLSRHEFGLEVQALPFGVGPLHIGAYANGGLAVIGSTAGAGSAASGRGGGGGALLEVDVTGRMALTVRGGASLARFDGGWSPATTLTAGLALY
jgi:hypothetical protein